MSSTPQDRPISVGVTGTNGKTSTTWMIGRVLDRLAGPCACVCTLGSYVGGRALDLPRSYRGFCDCIAACRDRGGRHAAIELTSESLAAGFCKRWPCHVGVFTNFSHDHLDRHQSLEHYLASKAQLFVHLRAGGTAVLNGQDPACDWLARILPESIETVQYGLAETGRWPVTGTLDGETWEGTRLQVRVEQGPWHPLQLPWIGRHFAQNALAAIAAVWTLGWPLPPIVEALTTVRPIAGRFERVAQQPGVIVDYAHTPDALQRTVETARRLCAGALTVVLGAGGDRDRDKRPAMGAAVANADRVILTSDNPRHEDPASIAAAIASGLTTHPRIETIIDRARAITSAIDRADPADVVVIAGKGHERTQTIDDRDLPFSDRDVARAALHDRTRQ